jgi:hypothetical protein
MGNKQQVLIIQGGTSFDNYNDYINYLKKGRQISLDRIKIRKTWKNTMDIKLGKNFEVFLPDMPNRNNARYFEWKIWFERVMKLLNKDLTLIGHSLGGIFLAKYFSENKTDKKIKALMLVSAPFNDANIDESLNDFILPRTLSFIEKQCKKIYLIQSKDDHIVPFEQMNKYKKELPSAKTLIFENRDHFSQETFPEIIKLIKEN